MKRFLLLFTIFLFLSCSPSPEDKLKYLNGYWEISEVLAQNGVGKSYAYNTTIDYIYIEDFEGFRKKLQPRFNNTYKTSNDTESLVVRIENDSLNLYYNTRLIRRKETVLEANESQLKIVNADQIIYVYKRYEAMTLNLE